MRTVDPARYTPEYYAEVQGHADRARSGGTGLPARLAQALRPAGPAPGMRLLDIGTGRGEVALSAASIGMEAGLDVWARAHR